eukprot:CAMPEP_0202908100 /NCGR_PEP_ID=MMETSP1392-20130828/44889_1 /ASSEMBLY_ACC=CAM_ASM_000868 /TAXON_ID=225041 /ORGANISM="Chlamydomonas chlamydogama, Strain SAG 11-48b" /LENGTH=370 /DNA_ID=CAMNT_0049597257 /DNA_START=155 /DNA_END=1264 /DNA_ORIENTATION=-
MANQKSVLDDLGAEITGIALPVSICMAVTVFLVRVLNPEGESSSSTVFIASVAYDENRNPQASSGEKLGGALLNALIFVAVIAFMTFVLVLLFKYGCYRVIFAYMGFAVFDIFFLITGLLLIQLLQIGNVHVDAFSFCYIMLNFSVIGTMGVLFVPIPLFLKQCYMVWVGIITAYIFTWIPEWTSWVLLVLMALYDIAAVLIPGGPLKMLVDLAIERQQALPALIYEARPTNGPYQGPTHWVNRGGQGQQDTEQGVVADGQPAYQPPGSQTMAGPQGGVPAGGIATGVVVPPAVGVPARAVAEAHHGRSGSSSGSGAPAVELQPVRPGLPGIPESHTPQQPAGHIPGATGAYYGQEEAEEGQLPVSRPAG